MRNEVYLEAYTSAIAVPDGATKSKILDKLYSACGYQLKYVIRLLGNKPAKSPRFPGYLSEMRPRCLHLGWLKRHGATRTVSEALRGRLLQSLPLLPWRLALLDQHAGNDIAIVCSVRRYIVQSASQVVQNCAFGPPNRIFSFATIPTMEAQFELQPI